MKPTYRKSWAGNLLMLLDFTFGHSFRVKRWFTGFGELFFQWIQICIGSLTRRSSSNSNFIVLNLHLTESKVHNARNRRS